MNIKQASEQSGVSSPNIRFYEKEGLLTPARNRSNAYRDYTAEDVRTLKLIRMLRMLDLPLPTIQSVLRGEQPLAEAIQAQQAVLEQQAFRLAGAIRFCAELTRQAPRMEQLDVDACLKRMQDPQEPGRFFTGWLKDYRTVAENEQKKRFYIVSEQSINTPEDFAEALQRYAEAQGSPLRITKGGMYPEFEWNGIRYKAWRGPLLRFHLLRSGLPGIAPNGAAAQTGAPASMALAAAPCGGGRYGVGSTCSTRQNVNP
jgi:MerR family copper efflux transcriptional regulator